MISCIPFRLICLLLIVYLLSLVLSIWFDVVNTYVVSIHSCPPYNMSSIHIATHLCLKMEDFAFFRLSIYVHIALYSLYIFTDITYRFRRTVLLSLLGVACLYNLQKVISFSAAFWRMFQVYTDTLGG